MILYDVVCSNDHVFEAWFADSEAFDKQRQKGEIACSICGDTEVSKALMAPNISAKKEQSAAQITEAAEAMKFLYKMREHVEENCDYVGNKFAEEARKIHNDEVEKRDIYGEATAEEAAQLREEGVEFGEIPWPARHDA
ncbi:MAG: DUF1178 family protein [Alphaproteobacteria bacterium]|nr:DUF1178 family protein [Alphaproteobacteria bacterium]MCY4498746.1 DUF1178 family protein [Rhodospirillaceae bacterium]